MQTALASDPFWLELNFCFTVAILVIISGKQGQSNKLTELPLIIYFTFLLVSRYTNLTYLTAKLTTLYYVLQKSHI
jgi:hypothetical protein